MGGKSTKPMSDAAKAAIARQERQNQSIAKYFQRQPANPPPRPNAAQIQGNLSEDEALARALQASLGTGQAQATGNGNSQALTQEEQDRMLALALAQGEQ